MATKTVALVTGSNKGIGLAIVRGLCKQFKGDVYLTAREESRGKEAVAELEREGLHPKFHQLDIDDPASVERLRSFLSKTYGGLDILVNNAGIAYRNDAPEPFTEQTQVTLKTNYWGLINVCKALFPLLRSHARVVNLTSFGSKWALGRCSQSLQDELRACKTVEDINKYMTKFVADVLAGTYQEQGWPQSAYGISKLGVTLVTPILQRDIDADKTRSDIIVNSVCPGWTATELSNMKGKSTDEGADSPLFLALLPPNTTSPRGEYFTERKIEAIWS